MKILYASANHSNSNISLLRFSQAMAKTHHTLKISAFKNHNSLPHIYWTLDSLQSVVRPEALSLDNENYEIYVQQIKNYNPDLIITDCEYFTSCAALELKIPLWQYSSFLLNSAIELKDKFNTGIFKRYFYMLRKSHRTNDKIKYIIHNADKVFVCSHLGDIEEPPSLVNGYYWSRPYHNKGKHSKLCEHNIVAGLLKNNRKIISLMNQIEDGILFSPFTDESFANVKLKDIRDEKEYYCNLYNSQLFVCEGQTQFLADAYYNNKFSVIYLDYSNPESVINSMFSERMKLSSIILNDIDLDAVQEIYCNYQPNIHFLHEEIERFEKEKNNG